MGILDKIKGFGSNIENKGSAFVRAAEHEAKILEAKGKVVALKAAETVANAALDELEKLAAEVHAGRDAIQSRLDKVSALL